MIYRCADCKTYYFYCLMVDDLCVNCIRLKNIKIYRIK